MIIYLSVLLLILIVSYFYEPQFRENKIKVISNGGTASDYKGTIIPWLIVFGWIAFIAGMRTNVNDSGVYADVFTRLQPSWNGIIDVITGKTEGDKGFLIVEHLFKMYISSDYHVWFLFVAAIESLIISFVLRRESVSFLDSCYFFVTSALFYNYFSMMRQWIAVIIIFWASKFIISRQFFPYLLFCLLAAQFHASAYFMIIVYFVVAGKAWGEKQMILIVALSFALLFSQQILGFIGNVVGEGQYDYVIDAMKTNSGSSWIRAAIAAVPVALSLKNRKMMPNDKFINLCVNFSIMNLLLNIVAVFTNGLYVIRMSTYAGVFNVILYPYLLNISIPDKQKKTLKTLFYLLFLVFFFFQMYYMGGNHYGSDILGYFD